MSLFIGNLSSSVNVSDLEKLFGDYGKCTIKYLGTYGFAEFDEEKDAEEAFNHLQGKEINGKEMKIEWSKKSNRYEKGSSSFSGRCYICGHRGHFARDCKRRRKYSDDSSRSRRHRHRSRRSRRKHSYSSDNSSESSYSRRHHRSRKHRRHSHRKYSSDSSSYSSSSKSSRSRSRSKSQSKSN